MSQGQSVRKLPGNEKSRIKHQRDREPKSLRQILDNEEQATQNNRNQGTAKHKTHQNKRHNHQTDTAPALSRMSPTVLKEWNCAGTTHSQHLFSVTKPSSPVRTSLLNYSAEKADLIPLCRRTKFCLQFLCTPMFLQSKNFPALTPKRKINWQDLDLRNDNEDKPKCCTGNQKGTSELKTQTKLFQAPSSMSKGSKLKKSLLPGPQKWGHFSAEKPVTWEGASPVWDPDAFFATSTWCSVKIFDAAPSHTRALQWSNLFKFIIKSALIDGFLLPCLQKCLQHRLIYKANICDFWCSF